MLLISRIVLLFCAGIIAGISAWMGIGLEYLLQDARSTPNPAIWLVFSLVITAPVWTPALLTDRYPKARKVIMWLCMILLLIPSWNFIKLLFTIAERSKSGKEAFPAFELLVDAILLCYVVALLVILYSLLKSKTKQPADKSAEHLVR